MRSATVLMTLVLAACAVGAHAAAPFPQVAVTACGQIIPKATLGYLTGDLDCTGYNGGDPVILHDTDAAITLGNKAKLDLRGFTLTASRWGVQCINIRKEDKRHGTCEIFNGSVVNAGHSAILAGNAYIHDVTITGSLVGLAVYGIRSRIENAIVTDNSEEGIRFLKGKMTGLTVSNNGGNGIDGYQVKLADSTVTGNATNDFCTTHPGTCFDVKSFRKPKVENVVCGTSGGPTDSGVPTWNVCSSD